MQCPAGGAAGTSIVRQNLPGNGWLALNVTRRKGKTVMNFRSCFSESAGPLPAGVVDPVLHFRGVLTLARRKREGLVTEDSALRTSWRSKLEADAIPSSGASFLPSPRRNSRRAGAQPRANVVHRGRCSARQTAVPFRIRRSTSSSRGSASRDRSSSRRVARQLRHSKFSSRATVTRPYSPLRVARQFRLVFAH